MSLNRSTISSLCLIGLGLLMAAWSGNRLLDRPEWRSPLNPLGINRSPYGEVFAMAMQGPIDTEFHVGMFGATAEEAALRLRQHHHSRGEATAESLSETLEKAEAACQARPWNPSARLEAMIARMQVGHSSRTNPRIASKALRAFLRDQAEDKLRFAYQLDPAHYANYNALHFFLTEGISTHPESAASVMQLARETIDYCRTQQDDPRPALTAAAACTNALHLLFAEHRKSPQPGQVEQMHAYLKELDALIATYHRISAEWDQNQSWQRLSSQRIDECQSRITFISNIRNAAETTIRNIENKS